MFAGFLIAALFLFTCGGCISQAVFTILKALVEQGAIC